MKIQKGLMQLLLAATSMLSFGAYATENAGTLIHSYDLATFQVNDQSDALPPTHTILTGSIDVNKSARQIILELKRGTQCHGKNCSRLAYPNFKLALPIVYVGNPECGGNVLTARVDNRFEGGEMIQLTVQSENGSVCIPDRMSPNAITVTVTEMNAHTNDQIVSTMSGFPVQL